LPAARQHLGLGAIVMANGGDEEANVYGYLNPNWDEIENQMSWR